MDEVQAPCQLIVYDRHHQQVDRQGELRRRWDENIRPLNHFSGIDCSCSGFAVCFDSCDSTALDDCTDWCLDACWVEFQDACSVAYSGDCLALSKAGC